MYKFKLFWSHKKSYNKNARWTEDIKDTYKNNESQMYEDVATGEIKNTLKRTRKWKLPRIDKLLSPPSILHTLTNNETYFGNHQRT